MATRKSQEVRYGSRRWVVVLVVTDIEWPVMSAAEREADRRPSAESLRTRELVDEWAALREEWNAISQRPLPSDPEPEEEWRIGDGRPRAVPPELKTELFVLHELYARRLSENEDLRAKMKEGRDFEAFYYDRVFPDELPSLMVAYETTAGSTVCQPLRELEALELAVSCAQAVREAVRDLELEAVPDTDDFAWIEAATRNAAAAAALIDERLPELDGHRVGLEYLQHCVATVHGLASGRLRPPARRI